MSQSASIWLVVILALVCANIPFLNQKLFGLLPRKAKKSTWLRLTEMLLLYAMLGLLARALEKNLGQIAPQGWQFYAVSLALFFTLAFPGFVYRYLIHRRD